MSDKRYAARHVEYIWHLSYTTHVTDSSTSLRNDSRMKFDKCLKIGMTVERVNECIIDIKFLSTYISPSK